ncbi:MAG: 4Fe-4S dicluster domain-containing protein [Candidatus Desulforudis sp.]|nr:4Fe-4S dicluster domain-containing protein [Desulforudis sp.]
MGQYGVLVDVTKCIGCRGCQTACKNWNDLPAVKTTFTADWTNPPEMNFNNITLVGFHTIEKDDKVQWRAAKVQCFHCLEPTCFEVCFVHAYNKTPEGAVVYANPEICVGCRYCQLACPFHNIQMKWDEVFSRVRKCSFCYNRLVEGLKPACVTTCPTGALKFGKRDELLQEAKERINSNPDKYFNHIYGEKEAGGTSWLYISDVPFEDLGFNTDVFQKSIPKYTWKYMKKAPILAVSLPIFFAALYAYTKRRAENEGHGH